MELIKGFKDGFKRYNTVMYSIINFVLVSIIYFFGVGLSKLIVKLLKIKLLNQDTNKNSSWEKISYEFETEDDFFNQY